MQYCTSKSNPEPYIVPIVSYHVLIANRSHMTRFLFIVQYCIRSKDHSKYLNFLTSRVGRSHNTNKFFRIISLSFRLDIFAIYLYYFNPKLFYPEKS